MISNVFILLILLWTGDNDNITGCFSILNILVLALANYYYCDSYNKTHSTIDSQQLFTANTGGQWKYICTIAIMYVYLFT